MKISLVLSLVLAIAATGCSGDAKDAAKQAPSDTAAAKAKPGESAVGQPAVTQSQSTNQNEVAGSVPPATQGRVTTPTGLRYEDLVVGTGPVPAKGQTAVVHYTGWLMDGKQIDSSVDRGVPYEFKLGAGTVMKGLEEGVSTMKVGGKRKLTIPPMLGYGAGAGGVVPPASTLVFEVELLGVK